MALNYYRLLGVPPDAGKRRIKSAYRSLAKRFHPDRNKGSETAAELFRQVNNAYKVLSDPQLRNHYDQKLKQETTSCGNPKSKKVHLDPQQKFNRFVKSLLDALFGPVDVPTRANQTTTKKLNKSTSKGGKPPFNFHYNLAVEKNKTPYMRGEDGIFRKAHPENLKK